MSKTITRLFDNYSDSSAAVSELEAVGVPHDDISLVANNADGSHGIHADDGATDRGARKGAVTGTVIGGTGGLLGGLGMLAIPGLGPIVAAGWLISTAVGAGVGAAAAGATGGLLGALKNAGENDADAHVYSEGVRRGGSLISVRVIDRLVPQAEEILTRHKSVTASSRGEAYRASGWKSFDETAPHYTTEQLNGERARYSGSSRL